MSKTVEEMAREISKNTISCPGSVPISRCSRLGQWCDPTTRYDCWILCSSTEITAKYQEMKGEGDE
jgi:hypothetical protein